MNGAKVQKSVGACCAFVLLGLAIFLGDARADVSVNIGYLERYIAPPPVLSNLEKTPENEGLAGVQVALKDVQTTGKFLKHNYQLHSSIIDEGGDFLGAAKALLAKSPYLVVKAPRVDLLALADLPEAKDALIFNVNLRDSDLRDSECRANILHTIASRAMLADALAQFAYKKKWTNWVVVSGQMAGDIAMSENLVRAAKKLHINIGGVKTWGFEGDMRRNASAEVPLFMQDLPDHDLVVVADEAHDFARYILYNTWAARPIAGSEGLVASTWSSSVEQHGAAQLQSRFNKATKRSMRPIDYAAWASVRSIGEAVTRINSAEYNAVRDYILSDKFQLAGFKGRAMTFRKWNGQLRQPIALTHPRALVAMAPIEGFLHRVNELDSLGVDEPQSKCSSFKP